MGSRCQANPGQAGRMCDHAPVLQVSQCLPRSVPAWVGDMQHHGRALAASYNQAFITM